MRSNGGGFAIQCCLFALAFSLQSHKIASEYVSASTCEDLGWALKFQDDIICAHAEISGACYNSTTGDPYNKVHQLQFHGLCVEDDGMST